MNQPVLELKNLKKHFISSNGVFSRNKTTVKAVDGIDLTVNSGETVGLVGESGCGKTTVGRTVLKLYEPTSGSIIFDGEEITNFSPRQMKPVRSKLQMIFQDPFASLNPRMKVGEIVEEGLLIHDLGTKNERFEKALKMLKRVGLAESDLNKYPHEFSGGQRQRIGIARALVLGPKVVVCDEPVSALDVSIQAQILLLLKELQQEMSLSYIFISHDLRVVRHIADEIAVMHQGKIVEKGSIQEVYESPKQQYTQNLLKAIPGQKRQLA